MEGAMSDVIGKGFQVLSIEGGKSIEVLYWLAPNAMCFTTWERPFDVINFDKAGQKWNVSEGLPANAVYIGTYQKPVGVSEALATGCEVVLSSKVVQAQTALHDAGFTILSFHPLLDESGDLAVPTDFEMVHTGGGCMALRRDIGDFYMLLTTGDGSDVPDLDDWGDSLIGVYRKDDGEEVACVTALEWFEVMGEQVPVLGCRNTP
ncbi:hypothetical protein YSA_p00142 (plasmid) [Pseudomonas putida ND6]|uniref:Uncharacterized protein n=3 Tax=Pseudomonadota TaxID=1224 RepID=A0A890DD54_ECOLX|nr:MULTISPECIES: hypothetical protein [Gammaproteobacteria]AFK73030.1 hypothetical protein YSA_p00142 [Pseudomonas putida ND6]QRG42607.1 hypothetical protein [Escherichia coli]UMW90133.1 hypothetical protein [Escherichia coli]UVN18755.1 Hypothetical protein [Pseudomonas aeruginosa]UVN19056.1 hypothetical protein [Pseudomonas aeruginosa]